MIGAARDLFYSVHARRWTELLDVAEAQLALVRAQLSLWTAPHGALAAPAPASGELAACDGEQRELSERLARAVGRAARLGVFRPRCLARAIALSRLLTTHGVHGHRMRIGVRREGAAFVAHAWVQIGDSVIGDSPSRTSTFVPLTDLRGIGDRFSA